MNIRLFVKKYSQILAFSGFITSSALLHYNKHIFDKINIFNSIAVTNNKAEFCSNELRDLLKEVGQYMKLSDNEVDSVVLYHTMSVDPLFNGFLGDRSSMPSIGLPEYYKYNNFDDTNDVSPEMRRILVKKSADERWDSPLSVEYRQSLVLNEDSKKFLLARQLCLLQYHNFDHINRIFNLSSVYVFYQIVFWTRKWTPFTMMPRLSRFLIFTIAGCMLYLVKTEEAKLLLSPYHSRADLAAITSAPGIGPRLRSGAIEFYRSAIRRQKALNKMGYSWFYTAAGAERSRLLGGKASLNGSDCAPGSHVRLSRMMAPILVTKSPDSVGSL